MDLKEWQSIEHNNYVNYVYSIGGRLKASGVLYQRPQ